MPVTALHRKIAAIALRAAAGHGFAPAARNALLAHGVITRPTQDVDLFTDQEHGVEAAAAAVETALRAAGLRAEHRDLSAGLDDVFPSMGEGLAEWIITAPDGEQMLLQMAYFDRSHGPGSHGHRPGAGSRRRRGLRDRFASWPRTTDSAPSRASEREEPEIG